MSDQFFQWLLAGLLAILIAGQAFRVRALSMTGAMAAVILGTTVVGTGGWWPGIILVVFFASSSLLSRLNPNQALDQARGDRRDWIQVLANGWGILVGCVLFALTDFEPWLLFGIGAIAAATADTWSSEIGRTSINHPRLVTTWRQVPPGTSGAVSSRGLAASFGGAAVIAVLAAVAVWIGAIPDSISIVATLVGITLAGVLGGVLDSLLGATIQEQRWCDACGVRTESNPHRCGHQTKHIGGIRGFDNDVVNFMCVLCGALIGLVSGIL